jgi:hypothetical protein
VIGWFPTGGLCRLGVCGNRFGGVDLPHRPFDRDLDDHTLGVWSRRPPVPFCVASYSLVHCVWVRADFGRSLECRPASSVHLADGDAGLTGVHCLNVGDFPARFARDNPCDTGVGLYRYAYWHDVRTAIRSESRQSTQVVLTSKLYVVIALTVHRGIHGRESNHERCRPCRKVSMTTPASHLARCPF